MTPQEQRLSETLAPIVFPSGETTVTVRVGFFGCDPRLARIPVRVLLPVTPCAVVVEDSVGRSETLSEQSPCLIMLIPGELSIVSYYTR